MQSDYTIRRTDPNNGQFTIKAYSTNGPLSPQHETPLYSSAVSANTSLVLLGKGKFDYGEPIQTNLVHMLENFASPIPPVYPIQGQLWYDNTDGAEVLKLFNGSTWTSMALSDYLPLTGGTITGDLTIGSSFHISSNATPTQGFHLANKSYVDSVVGAVVAEGGVKSVGLSLPNWFTVTGSPITTSGTLTASLTSQSANLVLASPNGSAGTPVFRSLVAADIPTLNQNTTGTAANVTGVVGVANGGTGATTAQTALNNLVGTQSIGKFLRSDGTNVTLSSIRSSDVPTLNQDTTGVADYAKKLIGGTTLSLVYQTGANSTGFLAAPSTPNSYLMWNGTAFDWNLSAGVNLVGLTLPNIFSVTTPTVTSVGYLTASLSVQSANQVFAGPIAGSAGVPTFRSLVASDIPTLNQNTTGTASGIAGGISNNLVYQTGASSTGFVTAPSVANTYLRWNGTGFDWAAGGGSGGGVASVGLSLPDIFTVTGSPITSSGTLTASLASQSANAVLIAPNGSAGAPTFRSLVAADIPTLNQNTTGTAANVTGVVGLANGGTGATTAQGAINALVGTQSSGKYLRSDGTNVTLHDLSAFDVTDFLLVSHGGTGATDEQSALNNLVGNQISGHYLRSDGTNVTMSAIQASDIPTLNQNTTGTAANVTGVVGITNGGTGATTAAAALSLLGGYPNTNPNNYITSSDNIASASKAAALSGGGINTIAYQQGANTTGFIATPQAANTFLRWNGSAFDWTSGGVGVSSVGLSLPNIFTVTGSPITTSGTLTATLTSQPANAVLIAPNGSAGTPTFRSLLAADIPILNQDTTGKSANVTGVVGITNGGTGATTAQAAINALAGVQSNGKYLRSDGNNVTLSTIQASDIPTLNQNTTGTATKATNIVGGSANKIPYQTAADATAFIGSPTTGETYLKWNGAAFVWDVATSNSIGVGQSYVDVTANRASGTTYTNTTGKPLFVIIKSGLVGGSYNMYVNVTVGGVNLGQIAYGGYYDEGMAATAYFVVPVGQTYSATILNYQKWFELR